jgi:Skp family chaperone for outer membrane proteins
MKYLFSKTVLAMFLMALLAGTTFGQTRIGTIDLKKTFDTYWKRKEALSTLNEEKNDLEKDLKNMVDDAKKAREAYQKLLSDASDSAISSDEREKRKKLAEDKFKQVREKEDDATRFQRDAAARLDERQKRFTDTLVNEIRSVISVVAKGHGFAQVLDVSSPTVLYTTGESDITDEVIKQLNANAPATKPDDTKEEKKDEKKSEKKKP